MKRRDALKLIAGAAAVPALYSQDLLALGRQIHQQLGSQPALKSLNPHQDATVTAIAEMIIPATDTPGAKGARVNGFIDLILSEWSSEADSRRFLQGLAETDARSRKMFGKDFVNCNAQQQTELLRALDEEVTELREANVQEREHASPALQESENPLEKNFFYQMKRLTLIGYYTSEVGWTQELGRPPVHMGPYQACVPLSAAGKTNAS
ncbi:MAG TPA: gluconate 2-dehydrogenase subunit 3 family protein [Terriglobales bacterium]|nr:gluconate 2-dehydrogenase subunit 3 family protein [Terriglobales bacterium]